MNTLTFSARLIAIYIYRAWVEMNRWWYSWSRCDALLFLDRCSLIFPMWSTNTWDIGLLSHQKHPSFCYHNADRQARNHPVHLCHDTTGGELLPLRLFWHISIGDIYLVFMAFRHLHTASCQVMWYNKCRVSLRQNLTRPFYVPCDVMNGRHVRLMGCLQFQDTTFRYFTCFWPSPWLYRQNVRSVYIRPGVRLPKPKY